MLEEEKEKPEGDVLAPREARTELSTFWPKLNVTPAALFSSVEPLLKENKAADGTAEDDDEEAAGGGEEEEAGSFFSSEPPSAEPAPYWRSMVVRWRS